MGKKNVLVVLGLFCLLASLARWTHKGAFTGLVRETTCYPLFTKTWTATVALWLLHSLQVPQCIAIALLLCLTAICSNL